jgi:hypothetical protein
VKSGGAVQVAAVLARQSEPRQGATDLRRARAMDLPQLLDAAQHEVTRLGGFADAVEHRRNRRAQFGLRLRCIAEMFLDALCAIPQSVDRGPAALGRKRIGAGEHDGEKAAGPVGALGHRLRALGLPQRDDAEPNQPGHRQGADGNADAMPAHESCGDIAEFAPRDCQRAMLEPARQILTQLQHRGIAMVPVRPRPRAQ